VVPNNVFVLTNLAADDLGPLGPFGRSLIVMDLDSIRHWVFPFTFMAGGPSLGQSMHAAISPDRRNVYVTMGGDATLPLRLLMIRLDWFGGVPTPTVTKTLNLLSAGSQGTNPVQAHGLTVSPDGLLLFMSELLAYPDARLRVVDTRTDDFVVPSGGAFGDPGDMSLDMPHGFFANPSMSMGMSTQYTFDKDKVTVWNIENDASDPNFGQLTHAVTVTLDTGGGSPRGAYTHTGAWINDTEFYVCASQETTQGTLVGAEAGVWHVDVSNIAAPISTQIIGEGGGGALEGVSDIVIASGSLFLAEGNFEKTDPPGHISIWDISGKIGGTTTAPVLIRRLSAGAGLPTNFREAHGLSKTPDGKFVLIESFRSNYVFMVHASTGNLVFTWTSLHGLLLPHGGYAN
jgi:hypothetical protein